MQKFDQNNSDLIVIGKQWFWKLINCLLRHNNLHARHWQITIFCDNQCIVIIKYFENYSIFMYFLFALMLQYSIVHALNTCISKNFIDQAEFRINTENCQNNNNKCTSRENQNKSCLTIDTQKLVPVSCCALFLLMIRLLLKIIDCGKKID